jgi:hypothetical protein
MDGITRWNPFVELDDLQNCLATLFGHVPLRKAGQGRCHDGG